MTSEANTSFCPLYREAVAAAPWAKPDSAHVGLLFDKFANAWRYKRDRNGNRLSPAEPEFDKGIGQKKEGANEWINRFKRKVGDGERLKEACSRQRDLLERLGGTPMFLKNTSRFVTGLGREHPLENGFAWHHTLGIPYLPGSSLKGMLRAWLRETEGDIGMDKHGNDVYRKDENIHSWFGTQGQAGKLIVLDMLPLSPPKLAVDVMTPHYGPYYQREKGNDVPGDWHSPVPITFLTVDEDCSWQLGIIPASAPRQLSDSDLKKLTNALREAIEVSGAGAKTAVGYGRFVVDNAAKNQIERKEAERRAQQAEDQRRAAEQAKFEASLAGDSEPLRQLKQLQRDQAWQPAASDNNMLSALTDFAEKHTDPPQDCLDWIREWLDSIPNYKGVWDQPDATKGKAKNPKYSSARIRELVQHLNPQLRR